MAANAMLKCAACDAALEPDKTALDLRRRLVCIPCYLEDPPTVDVAGVFAEVTAHVKADRLTELGRALGCDLKATPRHPKPAAGGLPDSCYFSGPLSELGPAPIPQPRLALDATHMAREARELGERARQDIIQFVQMRARYAAKHALKAKGASA